MSKELALPFDEAAQSAFLGHCLADDSFFRQIVSFIEPSYFMDPFANKVYRARKGFWDRVKRCPTLEELKREQFFLTMEAGERTRCFATMAQAEAARRVFGLDVLRTELTDWVRRVELSRTLMLAGEAFKSKETGRSLEIALSGAKKVSSISFEPNEEANWSAPDAYFEERARAASLACTFGNEQIDRVMYEESSCGGLMREDHTLIMGATNAGKTQVAVSVAVANVLQGKDVIYCIHEGRLGDLQDRVWQAILRRRKGELFEAWTGGGEARRFFEEKSALLQKHLTLFAMQKAGLTGEEVIGKLRAYQERRESETGKGYDLVIDDYPKKLFLKAASGGQWAPRQIAGAVYNMFTQLAGEFKCHVLTLDQVNREGNKINAGKEGRLLLPTDIAESFDATQTAANIVTLNRDLDYERLGLAALFVAKSRGNAKGVCVITKTRYDHALTHAPDLDYAWYRGDMLIPAENALKLVEKYKGKEIPFNVASSFAE